MAYHLPRPKSGPSVRLSAERLGPSALIEKLPRWSAPVSLSLLSRWAMRPTSPPLDEKRPWKRWARDKPGLVGDDELLHGGSGELTTPNFCTRALLLSATKMCPAQSTATPAGKLNRPLSAPWPPK